MGAAFLPSLRFAHLPGTRYANGYSYFVGRLHEASTVVRGVRRVCSGTLCARVCGVSLKPSIQAIALASVC